MKGAVSSGFVRRHQRLRRLFALAGLAMASQALAQQAASSGQPYDVNAVRPGQPGAERLVGTATSRLGEGKSVLGETPTYNVTRFLIEYRNEHPQNPSAEQVLESPVLLGASPQGYISPEVALGASGSTTTIRLRDITPVNPGLFSAGALSSVARSIVTSLQKQGLASIIVQLHPDDIDAETGVDKRADGNLDLRLIVWTGIVGQVRSVAAGDRFDSAIANGELERINTDSRSHQRIREQSPVGEGSLVDKASVDEYVFRLNRHPGRRVDVAVAPGAEEGQVALDYIISEAKPWSVYGQISNTGTENTNRLRERFGFVHNQLTSRDDVLRLDYITNGFDESHTLLASYDFPLKSDKIRLKVFGGYSEYDASEVGFSGESFTGQNYTAGAEVAWNAYQHQNFFLDLIGGLRWQSVKTTNELFFTSGSEQYAVPYLGIRGERVSDVRETYFGLTYEVQIADVSGANAEELNNLGRPNVDEDWQVLKFDAYHSFYVEPLISQVYKGTGDRGPTSLAHELAFSARGQYGFNNRLIPNEQDVVGGLFSVRGYPESLVAGDSVVIASAEYRFHWPRTWALSEPGTVGGRKIDWAQKMFGERMSNFRYAPQEPFGRADWDLIFKGFLDAGVTDVAAPQPGEDGQTLVGAGIGVEFQFKRHLTFRLDWGFALSDVDQADDSVDVGDNEVHFLLTGVY